MIPFTVDEFLNVLARYNLAIWPAQIFLYAIGVLAISLALSQTRDFSKSVSLILSVFWIWMGVAYHSWFLSTINRTAFTFAVFSILQGIFFLIAGVWTDRLKFHFTANFQGIIGSLFMVYALIAYPALAYWFGHRYPAAPTFGLPCPTTIFTFGMLLWTGRPVPLYLLAVPLAWSFIGVWAAISLGMTEDVGLLAAGLIGSMLIISQGSTLHTPAQPITASNSQST